MDRFHSDSESSDKQNYKNIHNIKSRNSSI